MTRVYLDNAASTPLDPEVLEYMLPFFRELQGNPSSVHSHGRQLRAGIEKARKTIAGLIGAAPSEIFFTSGGTEADNMAIRCSVEGLGIRHIITTHIEHHAVSHVAESLEKAGKAKITWLDVDEKGNPNLIQLEKALKENDRSLVCLMHANNEIGTLADIHAIGLLCEQYDAIFHSDTVPAMGNVLYNLSDMPVHFVTASAHKFYGPKGVGFLYVKSGTRIPSLILGGGQERNMRAGTENVPAIAGMAFALEKCINNLEKKSAHLWKLKNHMKKRLMEEVPGVKFNGEIEEGKSVPTVLNVAMPSSASDSMLLFNLDINGVSASGGSACTSGSVKGSHVLAGLGHDPHRCSNSVRFSFGWPNTLEEIDYAVDKVKEIVLKEQPVQ